MSPFEKNQNPLQIRVGDTVEIDFEHNSREPAFLADITEVVLRAGMGQDAGILYKRQDGQTNEPITPDGCSVSHVTKIVMRAPYVICSQSTPRNIFAEELTEKQVRISSMEHGWIGYYNVGGHKIGLLDWLIIAALAGAHDELSRPLDPKKFEVLWAKASFPGKVAAPDEEAYPEDIYTCVRWKAFKRFVLANRHRICVTNDELLQAGHEWNEAMWEDDYEYPDEIAA